MINRVTKLLGFAIVRMLQRILVFDQNVVSKFNYIFVMQCMSQERTAKLRIIEMTSARSNRWL